MAIGEIETNLECYVGLPYAVEIEHDEDGWFARMNGLPGYVTWADSHEKLSPMFVYAKRG